MSDTIISSTPTAVSAAGALTGTLDISAVATEYTVRLTVNELAAGKKARIVLEDSVNAFTASLPVHVWHFEGPIVPAAPVSVGVHMRNLRDFRAGVANAVCRLNVAACTAAAALKCQAELHT